MNYYQTSTLNCFYSYSYITKKNKYNKYNYTITLIK